MSNGTAPTEMNSNRFSYWAGYAIAVVGIGVVLLLFNMQSGREQASWNVYSIFFCSSLLLLLGGCLAFLFFIRHKQHQLEQQYLNGEIMQERQQAEAELKKQATEEKRQQQWIDYYFKLVELEKHEPENRERLIKSFEQFIKNNQKPIQA